MPSYDPTSSDYTTDVTIGAVTYIVTDFNDSGATAVGPDFQNSDGSYRGMRRVSGPRDASMTIEVGSNAEVAPAQMATFDYEGSTWVITQVGKAISSTGPATRSLSLRWVSAAA